MAVLRYVGPGLQAIGQARIVSLDEVNRRLATAPYLERLLGQHYRRLAGTGLLDEDLMPFDWKATNDELERIASAVDGFDTHQPIRTGRPRADIYATLAEIEGFSWLLEQNFETVEALPYRSIRGGSAPDARCLIAGEPSLFEVKSFWAYRERSPFKLKTIGNSLVFDERPPGRTYRDAAARLGVALGALPAGQHNTLLVHLTVERMLNKARSQLVTFANQQRTGTCPKTALLVMTQPAAPPPLIREAIRAVQAWETQHSSNDVAVRCLPEPHVSQLAPDLLRAGVH